MQNQKKGIKNKVTKKINRVIFELPLVFTLILIIEYQIWGNLNGWKAIESTFIPHPFWFPIILFGMFYGVMEGALAGLTAAILHINSFPDIQGINPLEWGGQAILPFTFIFVGTLIGLFRTEFLRNIKHVFNENRRLKEQIDLIDHENNALSKENSNLEKRIVFRLETFQSVYEIAQSLNYPYLNGLYKAIPPVIAEYLNTLQCSLFIKNTDGSLIMQSNAGWKENNTFPNNYAQDSPQTRFLETFRSVSVIEMDELASQDIPGHFLITLTSENGDLLGFIKIEEILLTNISERSLLFYILIGGWISEAIVSTISQSKNALIDFETGLLREDSFWNRFQKQVSKSLRHKTEFVLAILTINISDDLSQVAHNEITHIIGEQIHKACRSDDEIGLADQDSSHDFLFMLPQQEKKTVTMLQNKINQIVQEEDYGEDLNNVTIKPEWEILSLQDGELFLSDVVLQRLSDYNG